MYPHSFTQGPVIRSRDACRGVEYLAKLRARGPSFRLGEPLLKEAASVSAWLRPKTPATDSPAGSRGATFCQGVPRKGHHVHGKHRASDPFPEGKTQVK